MTTFSRRFAAALGICGVVLALAGCNSTTSGKPESGGATATSGQPGQGGQGGKGGKGGIFGRDGEDGADGANGAPG